MKKIIFIPGLELYLEWLNPESYLKMEFTSVLDDGKEKLQWVLCYTVLSNETIKA